jgi:hypothetical protein
MKGRGGYVTAFLFAHLAVWLAASTSRSPSPGSFRSFAIGLCTGVVLLSQPVWFLPLLPFLALSIGWHGKGARAAATLAGTLIVLGIGYLATLGNGAGYWLPGLLEGRDLVASLRSLPRSVWVQMSGAYYLNKSSPAGPLVTIGATVWSLALLFGLLRAGARGSGEDRPGWRVASLAALIVILLTPLLLSHERFGYRYLLPLTGFLIIPLALDLSLFWDRGGRERVAAIAGVIVLSLSGALSLLETGGPTPFRAGPRGSSLEAKAIDTLVERLRSHGIAHAYSVDPILQWNVIFGSAEKVEARWISPVDRYPAYPRSVDEALLGGEPVALVGRVSQLAEVSAVARTIGREVPGPSLVDDRFFYIRAPGRGLLQELGFLIPDREPVRS